MFWASGKANFELDDNWNLIFKEVNFDILDQELWKSNKLFRKQITPMLTLFIKWVVVAALLLFEKTFNLENCNRYN